MIIIGLGLNTIYLVSYNYCCVSMVIIMHTYTYDLLYDYLSTNC